MRSGSGHCTQSDALHAQSSLSVANIDFVMELDYYIILGHELKEFELFKTHSLDDRFSLKRRAWILRVSFD